MWKGRVYDVRFSVTNNRFSSHFGIWKRTLGMHDMITLVQGYSFWLCVAFDVFIEMMVLIVGLHLAEQMPSSPNSLLEWSLSSSLLKRLPCTALLSASFFLHEQANQEQTRRKVVELLSLLIFSYALKACLHPKNDLLWWAACRSGMSWE